MKAEAASKAIKEASVAPATKSVSAGSVLSEGAAAAGKGFVKSMMSFKDKSGPRDNGQGVPKAAPVAAAKDPTVQSSAEKMRQRTQNAEVAKPKAELTAAEKMRARRNYTKQ